ncbi:hypothetical protein MHYP_G00004880 [Metynnis hypsauchen]
MAGYIGHIGPFDENVEQWSSYTERFEYFVEANGIETVKTVSTFLSVMGAKTFTLLRSLVQPAKPGEKSYADIVSTLGSHFSPKPLVIAERFRFHKRNQEEGESVMVFVAALKKLSEHCEFGEVLSDTIRDRLVCGLRSEAIQKRLLSESKLTLQRATEISVSMELAAKEAQHLSNTSKMHKLAIVKPEWKPQHPSVTCFRCGKAGHHAGECWCKDLQCRSCGKKGHIERACKTKKTTEKSGKQKYRKTPDVQKRKKAVHVLHSNEAGGSESDSSAEEVTLKIMTVEGGSDGYWVTPLLEGHKGVIETEVQLNGQTTKLPVYIVKGNYPAILGRSWLEKIRLDWPLVRTLTKQTTGLSEVLDRHSEVFKDELGMMRGIKATLDIKPDSKPKFLKARTVPYAIKRKVEAALEDLVKSGVLEAVSISEWATPIVPVLKRDGAVRICGDFKVTVNLVLSVEQYPLPHIDDLFTGLAGGQRFSKIDLSQAYLQMPVDEKSKELLTIVTHKGLFRYQRLCFGITSAPSLFQRAMDQVLSGLSSVQCYLDDILVTGKTDEEHLSNLSATLQRLQDFGLRVRKDKCEFFKQSVEYLGHVIDSEGLHKASSKVKAIVDAPAPQNVSQLRSFLGLLNYYGKFIKNLATMLKPLHELLCQGKQWKWTEQCNQAFIKAKEALLKSKVLTHFNPKLPLQLACDASPYGVGAVLSHIMPSGDDRPIAFASRTLNRAERGYAQIEKEALGIVFGVRKFYQYLFGKRFTLLTDHRPLTTIFGPYTGIPSLAASRMQRWALMLSAHTYDIKYRKSELHHNADGLSRLPLPVTCPESSQQDIFYFTQVEESPVTAVHVRKCTRKDPVLSEVIEVITSGRAVKDAAHLQPFLSRRLELSVQSGCLLWGRRVVIPSPLRKMVLQQLHIGHCGMVRMKEIARSYFWWPGLDRDIEETAKSCAACQKLKNVPQLSPLHPWDWPETPWQRIHVDFAGPFEDKMFLVVVDAHSKWPEIAVMRSTTTAKTIEKLGEMFSRFGYPEQLVSDNGPQFISHEFASFMQANGVHHIISLPPLNKWSRRENGANHETCVEGLPW